MPLSEKEVSDEQSLDCLAGVWASEITGEIRFASLSMRPPGRLPHPDVLEAIIRPHIRSVLQAMKSSLRRQLKALDEKEKSDEEVSNS